MCSQDHDLVVVGGGPGGSTASTLVAREGHRVLLLEREHFPRYQIGESLLPSTVQFICAMLGVHKQVKAAGFVPKRGGTFLWGRRPEPWTFHFADSEITKALGLAQAYQVERSKFDEILLRNAARRGVEVREGCRVDGVIRDGDRIAGVRFTDGAGATHEARARHVVDASGYQSRLYGEAGQREFSRFFQNVACFCYFEGGKRLPAPNQGNILTAAFDEGWCWYIPLSDSLTSVGLVVDKARADDCRDPESMRAVVDRCPIVGEYLADATRVTEGPYGRFRVRKDYSYCNERLCAPGLFLVGDAACFIDPVFSTGVHLATYAGLLAARSVNTCLSGEVDEARCLEEFETRYRAEYTAQYKFLLGFYDMNSDREDYFWKARSVLGTAERGNEAFVRLVSGVGTTSDAFFRDMQGAGAAFDTEVGREAGEDLARSHTASAFEIMRTGGSSDDLVPRRLRLAGTDVRGAHVPGRMIPTDDGMRWEVVASRAALRPTDRLRHTATGTADLRHERDGAVLYMAFGGVEIRFDDRNLIAFGQRLVAQREFAAGDATAWAADGRFRWEDVREILDQLLAEGVLVRAE